MHARMSSKRHYKPKTAHPAIENANTLRYDPPDVDLDYKLDQSRVGVVQHLPDRRIGRHGTSPIAASGRWVHNMCHSQSSGLGFRVVPPAVDAAQPSRLACRSSRPRDPHPVSTPPSHPAAMHTTITAALLLALAAAPALAHEEYRAWYVPALPAFVRLRARSVAIALD
jgi:hypothetical protein